jgi:DNA-binding MarR family transcriptional regulator
MDRSDIRTLKILEEFENDQAASQRDLAKKLNISLGLVNSFVGRLAKKGYFKITHIPKKRVRYVLTAEGAAEKSRLAYDYIRYSYQFYKSASQRIRDLLAHLERQNVEFLVLCGANDLAEIIYIHLQETSLKMAAIADDHKAGQRFFRNEIIRVDQIPLVKFDKLIITGSDARDVSIARLKEIGIRPESVVTV